MEDTRNSTASWNLDEYTTFRQLKAKDGLVYSVIDSGDDCADKKAAELLAKTRKELNTILIYIIKHPELWKDKKLDFTFCKYHHSLEFYHGILHMLDLHLPGWQTGEVTSHFGYQECPHNEFGILGLNKPHIIDRQSDSPAVYGRNGLAVKRHILLTLRNKSNCFRNELERVKLAVHELTHTASNDVDWIHEKDGGNHQPPYRAFHSFMLNIARKTGVLKDCHYYSKKK
jgi:hypothetical protein